MGFRVLASYYFDIRNPFIYGFHWFRRVCESLLLISSNFSHFGGQNAPFCA